MTSRHKNWTYFDDLSSVCFLKVQKTRLGPVFFDFYLPWSDKKITNLMPSFKLVGIINNIENIDDILEENKGIKVQCWPFPLDQIFFIRDRAAIKNRFFIKFLIKITDWNTVIYGVKGISPF